MIHRQKRQLRRLLSFIPQTLDLLTLPLAMGSMRLLGLVPAPRKVASRPASILIISVEGLGDTILTVPLLRAVRRRWPDARITLLVADGSAALFSHCPYVDRVLRLDRPGYSKTAPRIFALGRLLKAARFVTREMGGASFDMAINTDPWTNIVGAGFIAWCTGAGERIAAIAVQGNPRRAVNRAEERLYSTLLTVDGNLHRILYPLEIPRRLWGVEASTDLELWPSAEDEDWAVELLGNGEPLIALGIGGSDPRRRWSAAAFINTARQIAGKLCCRFAILGNSREAAYAERIAAGIGQGAISLCGEEMNRVIALLGNARVYFGNDNGSMHMAAARGVPCLVVCCHPRGAPPGHLNAEQRYHPWNVPYRYLRPGAAAVQCREGCVASEAHCILGITPEEAVRELMAFLKEPRRWAENESDHRAAESA